MNLTYNRVLQFLKIYDRIALHYGPSKYHKVDRPEVYFMYDTSADDYGLFDFDNITIAINFAACYRTSIIIKTMIHEYTHFLQSPTWYVRYGHKHGYTDHPYEVEAWEVADRDWRMFVD